MTINRTVLLTADRGHILRTLAQFGGKPIDDWLSQAHPGRKGRLPRKWSDVNKLPPSELIEATAAAAPNHCIDGWSYASRSLSALLAGDLHAARHLAYYAQLRAGLSILAHLGIGIFNGINFAIQANGAVVKLDVKGLGTHSAVWAALESWVSEPAMARQFLDLVRIGNSSLSDCLDAIWPGASKTAIAGSLIAAWGLDLKRGETEHVARNMSSYNPQGFDVMPDDPGDRLAFVESFWDLFQPTSSNKFDLLDRSLLRALLWQQHDLIGAGPKTAGAINQRYDQLPENVKRIASKAFLVGQTEPHEPKLLKLSRSPKKPALATHMIARALLLLRAATGFTVSNFQDAGVSLEKGDLRPWIDNVAVARGFWGKTPLADPSDLWEDVRIALQDLAKSKTPRVTSLNDWVRRFPAGLPMISEAERIGVWSFGS